MKHKIMDILEELKPKQKTKSDFDKEVAAELDDEKKRNEKMDKINKERETEENLETEE